MGPHLKPHIFSPLLTSVLLSSLHYYSLLLFTCRFSLFAMLISSPLLAITFLSSCCYFLLLFALSLSSPFHICAPSPRGCSPLLFIMLLSSSHCCSPFLFTLLFSSPLRIVALQFALMFFFVRATIFFSYLHCCFPLLFALLLSSSRCWFLLHVQVQSSSLLIFFTLRLFLCCYLLKDLALPPSIPSCRSWESLGVDNPRLFSNKFFFPFLCFFSFYFFFFSSLLFICFDCFCFWFVT